MNLMYRKELSKFQTNFLIKIKQTLLDRASIEKKLTKPHTNMLVDVLSELDSRRIHN